MSERRYTLMHKDNPCAVVIFGSEGKIDGYKLTDPMYAPFLGNCDIQKFSRWWAMRAVPASRTLMRRVMQDAGVLTPEEYLEKNLALSITDTYWVCPQDAGLTYEDVRFSNFSRHGALQIPYHNATSYDMNASLGGQMEKYWDLGGKVPVLIKESSHYFGQQAINEVFATRLHQMQNTSIPFVVYSAARTSDGILVSKCPTFTTEQIELIPAYEIIESSKIRTDQNLYHAYIDLAVSHGIDRSVMQDFMDYQTLTDFLISNTDEHLLNFGVLRDSESMRLTGPAPIFDSGNSMFYTDERTVPYTRVELLQRKITSFYQTEEKMLANDRNKKILRLDCIPTPEQVMEFYSRAGIPEEKASFISRNYEIKASFLDEFLHGKKISLYQEKQKEKEANYHPSSSRQTSNIQRFVMIVGKSAAEVRKKAEELLHQFEQCGYSVLDSSSLYPAIQADKDCAIVADPYQIAAKRIAQTDGKPARYITYVSIDNIQSEREKQDLPTSEDLTFVTACARIRQAMLNGDSVIFSVSNPDSEILRNILRILPSSHPVSKELVALVRVPQSIEERSSDSEIIVEGEEDMRYSFSDLSAGWDLMKTMEENP